VPLTNIDDYNRMTLFSLPFSKFFLGKTARELPYTNIQIKEKDRNGKEKEKEKVRR
jgi:hypothetical protein